LLQWLQLALTERLNSVEKLFQTNPEPIQKHVQAELKSWKMMMAKEQLTIRDQMLSKMEDWVKAVEEKIDKSSQLSAPALKSIEKKYLSPFPLPLFSFVCFFLK
jgi:hypothetical protein